MTLESVSLTRDGVPVLTDIDLTLRRDRIVTVIGPNGAGKTTLARLAIGLIPPSAGQVRRRPGVRIGYVPQRLHPDPVLPLTALRLITLTRSCRRDIAAAALAEVGAAAVIDRPVHTLSGGELQRVSLARALIGAPDLLVLDEPVQNVDVGGQIDLYEVIARIRRQRRCGVLLISHDLHVVLAAADQVICLDRRICCAGHPEDIREHPEFLGLFGDRGARVLSLYAHHRHGDAGLSHAAAQRVSASERHIGGAG